MSMLVVEVSYLNENSVSMFCLLEVSVQRSTTRSLDRDDMAPFDLAQ